MSAEQDKEPIALKRVRGGDSGLDGLGGPTGVQLGSPDKKKRKTNAQGPSFPPLSEYAPPPNPNSDHLVAANPFDDNYNALSYKPVPASSAYLGPGYAGFGGYGTFRMPPQAPPRLSGPYCAPYALRNQPHPFPQNPLGVGFNRAPAFNFGPPESPGFGSPPYGGALSQHLRPAPAEGFAPLPGGQVPTADLAPPFAPPPPPGSNSSFASPLVDPHQAFLPPAGAFGPAKAGAPAKPDFAAQGAPKSLAPTPAAQAGPHLGLDEAPPGPLELKGTGRGGAAAPQAEAVHGGGGAGGGGCANGTQQQQQPPPPPPGAPRATPAADGGAAADKGGPAPPPPRPADPVYPCGICTHEVNDDQDAILCEASCQKWFHRICTGMTETAYGLLTAEAAAVWGCDACMAEDDVQLRRTREPFGRPAGTGDA